MNNKKEPIKLNKAYIIIIIVAVLISYVVSFYFTYEYKKDIGFTFGFIVGTTLLASIISYIISKLFNAQWRNSFIGILIIINLFWSYVYYQKAYEIRKIDSTIDNLIQKLERNLEKLKVGEEQSNVSNIEDEFEQTNKILIVVTKYFDEIASESQNYVNELEKLGILGIDEILDIGTFSSQSNIRKKKQAILVLEKIINNYEKKCDELYNPAYMENLLRKENINEDRINSIMDGYKSTLSERRSLKSQFFEVERQLADIMPRLLTFIDSIFGDYYIKGGRLYFESENNLNVYNNYVLNLLELAEKEEKITNTAQLQFERSIPLLKELKDKLR